MKRIVGLSAALLLAFWGARLLGIGAFPPFLDEAIHVWFAENSLATSPLNYANEGRLFTVWAYLPFAPFAAGGVVLARVVTLLAVLLAFAAAIGIGRMAAGRDGLLLSGALLLFSPFHHFYDRLALADTLAGAAVVVALYFAYRLSRRAALGDAFWGGVALFVAIGAKVSALPFLGVPVAAALAFRQPGGWRWLAAALATSLGLTALFALGLRLFDYDLFYLIGFHNQGAGAPVLERLMMNARTAFDAASGYFGVTGAALLLGAVGVLLVRREPFLPLCAGAPLLVIWLNARQSTRFLYAAVTILLLCGALALLRSSRRRWRFAAFALVCAWGILTWLPFARTAALTPIDLPLPAADRSEYIGSDASGFGLHETLDALQAHETRQVLGLLSNCQALRYLALSVAAVECPRINPNGEDVPVLARLMEQRRAARAFVVLEASPYVPSSAPGQLITTIQTPGGRPLLMLYQLSEDRP